MADPTPTYNQVMNAIASELGAASLTATILHWEDRRKNELELLREFRQSAPGYEVEILLMEADVEGVEGNTHGENYSIYQVELRHLYSVPDEEETSRIAKHRAEQIRGVIEGNTDIFRIGGQVPLRTPETVSLTGRFVDREDSRYYETIIKFEVEGRRWQ